MNMIATNEIIAEVQAKEQEHAPIPTDVVDKLLGQLMARDERIAALEKKAKREQVEGK